MIPQRTLRQPVRASGIGLHSGRTVAMSVLPAAPGSGIVFRRTDLSPSVEIPASALLVTETTMCTCLDAGGARVATVEHILSALTGLGVDNAIVELSAPEVPIMDGSAGTFVYLIQSAGLVEQSAARVFLKITQPIQVRDGDKSARFEPHDGYRLSFDIEFDHPVLRSSPRTATVELTPASYIREISRARTFGFMREFEWLRSKNLALGASLDNAVALDEFRVMNPDGLRYDDEFVRHKILDAVGDLSLVGYPILGSYVAHKSGHGLNNMLARAVLAAEHAWELVSFPAPVYAGPELAAAA